MDKIYDIFLKIINTGKSEELIPQLNDVRTKMNIIGAEMQKL